MHLACWVFSKLKFPFYCIQWSIILFGVWPNNKKLLTVMDGSFACTEPLTSHLQLGTVLFWLFTASNVKSKKYELTQWRWWSEKLGYHEVCRCVRRDFFFKAVTLTKECVSMCQLPTACGELVASWFVSACVCVHLLYTVSGFLFGSTATQSASLIQLFHTQRHLFYLLRRSAVQELCLPVNMRPYTFMFIKIVQIFCSGFLRDGFILPACSFLNYYSPSLLHVSFMQTLSYHGFSK